MVRAQANLALPPSHASHQLREWLAVEVSRDNEYPSATEQAKGGTRTVAMLAEVEQSIDDDANYLGAIKAEAERHGQYHVSAACHEALKALDAATKAVETAIKCMDPDWMTRAGVIR